MPCFGGVCDLESFHLQTNLKALNYTYAHIHSCAYWATINIRTEFAWQFIHMHWQIFPVSCMDEVKNSLNRFMQFVELNICLRYCNTAVGLWEPSRWRFFYFYFKLCKEFMWQFRDLDDKRPLDKIPPILPFIKCVFIKTLFTIYSNGSESKCSNLSSNEFRFLCQTKKVHFVNCIQIELIEFRLHIDSLANWLVLHLTKSVSALQYNLRILFATGNWLLGKIS